MCSIDQTDSESSRQPSLQDLERDICELAAHLAAATCRWLSLVAEFDERRGWAELGVPSCANWLSWRCGIGLRAAREQVRVGRALRGLPLINDAFGQGELSYSKVRALTRVATPATEADLVEIAHHATGAQVEKLVRGYRGALSATLAGAQQAQERRYCSWFWDDDGSLRVNARLSGDEGALLLAALKAAEEQRPDEAETACAEAARADALVSVARAALAGGTGERAGGDPVEVVVHVDAESLAGDAVECRSELADGGSALATETVRRLGCDAAVVGIIERDGEPLSVGRRKRTVPAALRRALRSRDGGCRFPGCEHRRFLHAHHIQHWARGGPTELGNLVQLCSHHHRLVHEGGFMVERAGPAGVRFRRPDGQVIPAACETGHAAGHGIERQHLARGLRMNADTCRPRSAGDRLDYGIAVEALCARELRARGRPDVTSGSVRAPRTGEQP
jgi:hypothetical protein